MALLSFYCPYSSSSIDYAASNLMNEISYVPFFGTALFKVSKQDNLLPLDMKDRNDLHSAFLPRQTEAADTHT